MTDTEVNLKVKEDVTSTEGNAKILEKDGAIKKGKTEQTLKVTIIISKDKGDSVEKQISVKVPQLG
ncbi:hypothetical protein [Clostridium haemolyticum]|uniref:Uncharacterized protein n=1 Tax=Clostridium haemolyticum NCTC 9693 TaxID=1443114 RepID=A0ABR4TEV7_CLOHA|nr:hypothetical protein [Clostridium haemolyticum]KEI16748.1 hypothetical protein Z960_08370 [Clostridium haemolyticum NCTC 9693]KGN04693.1 hypothetical protein Z961_01460 [Clostridium haemolyticum NCTC 8350]